LGVVLGWIFETLADLVFVGAGMTFHEKYPRLSWTILAVLLTLMAGLLVWAFWLAPAA
jgi:hypothetical protein